MITELYRYRLLLSLRSARTSTVKVEESTVKVLGMNDQFTILHDSEFTKFRTSSIGEVSDIRYREGSQAFVRIDLYSSTPDSLYFIQKCNEILINHDTFKNFYVNALGEAVEIFKEEE